MKKQSTLPKPLSGNKRIRVVYEEFFIQWDLQCIMLSIYY